jgi:hypothetical protein
MISALIGMLARAMIGGLAWVAWLIPRTIVPRRDDWVAVLGRNDGAFVDNCKYFFIGAQSDPNSRVVYVTSQPAVLTALRAAGVPVLHYPGFRAAWFLLRAGAAVVDTTEWSQRGRRAILSGSRIVQMWHGVGFKRIERDRWKRESGSVLGYRIRCFLYQLSGRLVRYDAVLTTSRFYERELFKQAFLAHEWLPANYPRNTFGRSSVRHPELVTVGVDESAFARIESWVKNGSKVVLVAPTFRDDGTHSLPMNEAERSRIVQFCRDEDVRLAFKMHPLDSSEIALDEDVAVTCASRSDIYPMLGWISALVTDYSSIYMDFLVANQPILFHVPDLANYVAQREIQFDLADMTPGPKSTDWDQLLTNLHEQLESDGFGQERERLRALAFDDHDPSNAVATILRHLQRQRGHEA